MFNQVTRKLLSQMSVGESTIFTEAQYVKNAGQSVTALAIRAGIRVTTKRCFIVFPSEDTMTKAVCVTRVS